MNFQPKSERQIAEEGLNPAGIYMFEIVDAKDEVSKKGNDMIKLSLRLFNSSGDNVGMLSDYLLESIAYKLRHASYACGLGDKYEMGSFTADDFIGKSGELRLVIKKDKNGQYPDQNSVSDYIAKKEVGEPAVGNPASLSTSQMLDDGVPF